MKMRKNTLADKDHHYLPEVNISVKKNKLILTACLFLLLTTLAVYWQVVDHQFISLDDVDYVTKNIHIQQGFNIKSIKWAFTSYHAANWHPVTWLSLMLDYRLFGLNPTGYHLVNLFFHLLSTLFLFLILYRTTTDIFPSLLVALLFALHPLHVESVAWVSERKDVLSTLFFMLSISAYVLYTEKQGIGRYLMVLILFIVGLMTKPMLVTLPFLLLLMDYWPLQRFKIWTSADDESNNPTDKNKNLARKSASLTPDEISLSHRFQAKSKHTVYLLLEKIPLITLSLLSAVMTMIAQSQGGAVKTLKDLHFWERIDNACMSYVFYIIKMFWPFNLAVYYPHPVIFPLGQVLAAVFFLMLITVLAIYALKRWPFFTVGWLWYLGTLVPVIGIIQVGTQSMADRYTYIPLIGLFIILAWGVPALIPKWSWRKYLFGFSFAILVIGLIKVSWMQVGYWQNDIKLYRHALEKTSNNDFINYCVGDVLFADDRPSEAMEYYLEAVRINPLYADAYFGAGHILNRQGKYEEAVVYLKKALEIEAGHNRALRNIGYALTMKGKFSEAQSYFEKALMNQSENQEIHYDYGILLVSQKKLDQAISHFMTAVQIDPYFIDAKIALGNTFLMKMDYAKAAHHFLGVLKINPHNEEAHYGAGNARVKQGMIDEAIYHFHEAVNSKPDFAEAYNDLGSALSLAERYEEAIANYQAALRLKPDYEMARENLKTLKKKMN